MTCGNPACRYEFCWICMQETVPNHYDYGPCAGKQFLDTESLVYDHPCLAKFLFILEIIGLVILCIIAYALPFIPYSILFFAIIFLDEGKECELDFKRYKTHIKIIMYIGYVLLSIALRTICYITTAICLAGLGLIIVIAILIGIVDIFHIIISCLFCNKNDDENEIKSISWLIRIFRAICDE